MTSVFEQIKEANRMTRMRLGQDAPEMVTLMGHPEIRLAMVPLAEKDTQAGVIYASTLGFPDNAAGIQASNRAVIHSDLWHGLRDPGDITKHAFPTIEAMVEELGPEEIDNLADQMMGLMDYSSPTMDGLTQEMVDDLKKASDKIEWKGLSGRRWGVTKLYLSVMSPELLAVSFSGSGSTASSTQTNGSDEST